MSDLVTIDFHGNAIIAVLVKGVPYVAMKPLCEGLGLQWSAQLQRINRDPLLISSLRIMPTPTRRGTQDMVYLPLPVVNGWLVGVQVSRIRPELREKLVQYQREAYRALSQAFLKPSLLDVLPVNSTDPTQKRAASIAQAGLEVAKLWGVPTEAAEDLAIQSALDLTGYDLSHFKSWPVQPETSTLPLLDQEESHQAVE